MDNSNIERQTFWETNDFPQSLLGDASARASKINFSKPPSHQLENLLTLKPIDDLCKVAAQQQKEQQALLKKHQDLSYRIRKLNASIEKAAKEIENLKNDLSLTSEEYKTAAKPLVKAIKKYSTSLGMQISGIKKHENEQFFVATVKFSSKVQSKFVNFIIDSKNKKILDFDAETVLNAEETTKLKQQAKTEDGWDLDMVLKKLREYLI